MKRKDSVKWFLTLTMMVGGLTSCGVDMPQMKDSSFETMTVKKSDIELPYKFSARMKGQNDVTVTPQVSGQLMKICVTEGQQVKKGQTLFIIDSRNAQLELEAAQANLQAALAQENSAKLEYESNKNLFDKKIVSSYMLNNSENSYKQAQAAVAQARASVNRAKVNLGFCTITASVSGIIGEIPVRVGDQVSPMTQLTMLSGNTTMYAEFSVTEAIVEAMVKEGMKAAELDKYIAQLPEATFVMKNGTEYPHKGRIISLTGVVNAETGSLTSKVSFPNPDGHLYSGIQGTIVMPFAEKSVIVIPQYAVVRLQDKAQVYKVNADSTATAVEVTTEDTGNGKEFIVTSGLNVGDRIVTVGANNVTEGQKVLFPEGAKSEK
ncbi:efflux RND transporter periplasmic adaptor subunit [Prevotella sp. tf2-5]|uniref:efflux RND transporter periplasmic adaptor subunit n=1 Tax=Prevotella sp. tf2-5 TaxID=1761889 RepID=UPI0008E2B791|nr:efflux RND transporter periplasmic adaptor subunit [Prevotella sp. tf2-5]SFO73873.1 membrane fusion protein, multidrug efflux system [Prevotella sp. tf2-5]